MQKDLEKITKTNKTQIKLKQKKFKIETKTTTKNKQTIKESLSKKEIDVEKQELTSTDCRGTEKESQIDWIFCKICAVCVVFLILVFRLFT